MYKLDSQWNLWYHSINDQNWSPPEVKLQKVDTTENVIRL